MNAQPLISRTTTLEPSNIARYAWLAGWGLTIVLALYLRLDNLGFGLPGQRLHPDEGYQVETAWRIVRTGDLNPHFFKYPSATIYLFAAVYKILDSLGKAGGLANLYLVGRALSVAFSVGLVVIAGFWISRWVGSGTAGLFAGLLMALLYTSVEQAHYAIVDVPLSFWMALSLIFCMRAANQGDKLRSRQQLLLAALFAGIAIATKYTALVLAVPLVAADWQLERPEGAPSGARSRLILTLVLAAFLLLGGIALVGLRTPLLAFAASLTTDGVLEPEYLSFYRFLSMSSFLGAFLFMAVTWLLLRKPHLAVWNNVFSPNTVWVLLTASFVFLAFSPYVLIDWRHFAQDMFYEYRHVRVGLAATVAASSSSYRLLLPTSPFPSFREVTTTVVQEWGWPALVLVVFGAVMLWLHSRKAAYVLLSFVLVMGLTLFSAGYWATRYLLPLYFPMACLAAYGMGKISNMLSSHPLGAIVAVGVAGLCVFPIVAYTFGMAANFRLPETRELAYVWMLENVKPGSYVVEDAYTPDFGIVPPPFQVQTVLPGVLDTYTPEQLYSDGVQVFVTTQPLTSANRVDSVPQPDGMVSPALSRFYSLVKVFGPDVERTRGKDIYIFESKDVGR